MKGRRSKRGSAMLEFVLTGIPLIFVWISIVQMSLGMWHYHTMQFAIKAAGAYIAHHGSTYVATGNPAKTLQDAANVFAQAAIGVPASAITVTWTSGNTTINCTLNNCQTNTTTWPPTASSSPGTDFTIRADYLFRSAIAFYSPGTGAGHTPVRFGAHHLPSYTRQFILF